MASIVDMIVDELIDALEELSELGHVGRAPFAEQMEEVDSQKCVAVVSPNDPDSQSEWLDELNRDNVLIGQMYLTHRPFYRRFTILVKRNYYQSNREDASEDFSTAMRAIESTLYSWTGIIGPDDYGESTDLSCGAFVKSRTQYTGGDTDILAAGKIWVEFKTS